MIYKTLRAIFRFLKKTLKKIKLKIIIYRDKYDSEYLSGLIPTISKNKEKLTKDEIRQIKKVWKKYPCLKTKLKLYQLMKNLNGKFSPEFIFKPSYYHYIVPKLNNRAYGKVFSDKSLYNLFLKDFSQPKLIVQNIGGIFFNSDYKILTQNEAISEVLKYNKKIIIKPSTDSFGGKGIVVLESYTEDTLIKQFNSSKKDFVIQEFLQQSSITQQFNPSSLNTFRFTILNINSKASILKIFFRFGAEDSFVDNISSGGFFIDVKEDGKIHEFAYNKPGLKLFEKNGIVFKDFQFPNFSELKEFAISCAKMLPNIGICGLDITLDKNDKPILIEINLRCPGILDNEVCSGPTFGERFNEVFEYITKSDN